MREVERRHTIQPRGILARAADGRLKPASEGLDVADVWADQKRIQLTEAIQEDQKKVARKQRRAHFFSKRKVRSVTPDSKPPVQKITREVELKISLPKLPRFSSLAGGYKKVFKNSAKRKFGKKIALIGGVLAVVVVAVFGVRDIAANKTTASGGGVVHTAAAGALSASDAPDQTPTYATILPKGKSIDMLGGWGRVSPPDKNPVFAFADTIGGAHVTVSEQPLPDNFKIDVSGEVAKLAKQFNADQKLPTSEVPAYVGATAKGQQSVVLAAADLLILMKSDAKLTNEQWAQYISNLE